MKYIRTENGVYEQHKCILNGWNFVFQDKIKEANTIEELCDEVVVEIKFGSTGYIAHLNKRIDELKSFVEYLKNSCEVTKDEILNIYGAIWTDKGLIYVAKMNEEGKLCLI